MQLAALATGLDGGKETGQTIHALVPHDLFAAEINIGRLVFGPGLAGRFQLEAVAAAVREELDDFDTVFVGYRLRCGQRRVVGARLDGGVGGQGHQSGEAGNKPFFHVSKNLGFGKKISQL